MSKPRQSSAHKRTRRITDAVKVLDAIAGRGRRIRTQADLAVSNALIGQLIHDARTEVGLTQKELAKLVGTDQSVISRLEDADYEGHSLSMLRRVADALGKTIEVRFVDAA